MPMYTPDAMPGYDHYGKGTGRADCSMQNQETSSWPTVFELAPLLESKKDIKSIVRKVRKLIIQISRVKRQKEKVQAYLVSYSASLEA